MEAHTRDGVSAGVPKGPLRLRPSACTHLGFQPSLNTRVCALAGVRISRPWGAGGWVVSGLRVKRRGRPGTLAGTLTWRVREGRATERRSNGFEARPLVSGPRQDVWQVPRPVQVPRGRLSRDGESALGLGLRQLHSSRPALGCPGSVCLSSGASLVPGPAQGLDLPEV